MIRTIDRYVLKEFAIPFIVGTAAVVLMFLANMLIAYGSDLFTKRVPFSAVMQLLLFKIPSTLNLTLPVGVTIASAFAMSRLVRESELSAIRAAGVPIRRVVFPMTVLGLFVSMLSFYLGEEVTPRFEKRSIEVLRKIGASSPAINVQANVLISLNNGEYYLSVGSARKESDGGVAVEDIIVFHKPKKGEDLIAQASTGRYFDGILSLNDAYIRHFQNKRLVEYEIKSRYDINQRVSIEDFFSQPMPEEMTLRQLGNEIQKLKSRGIPTKLYEVDYQNRFAVPAACLVFSLFSPVFAIYFSRGGAFMGVLVSIFVVFAYYNVWVISSQILSKDWILSPILGAWLPNVLFICLGMVFLWRSE